MTQTKKISFRLVAYTDAAGKYSPTAFRNGNEDNFFVDDDLANPTITKASQDEILQLGSCGMLMVVADGMGGANAGEVASQIAIDTVKNAFRKELLSSSVVQTIQSRQKYLEQTIKTADKNIKFEAGKDKSREGMGSTIIIAWLYENELSISWCGDSRAYLFNEKSGIRLVSQDHSYVQELVNKGLLTYDQTFDHPQNNIITRSLGDPTKDAKPESRTLKVGKGDIILVCSDGLSGVLRDRKTHDSKETLYPGDNLEDIIRANTDSMKKCREALWVAAEKSGWYDNVTAILCQIIDGPESQWMALPVNKQDVAIGKTTSNYIWIGLVCIAFVIGIFFVGLHVGKGISQEGNEQPPIPCPDTATMTKDCGADEKEEPTPEKKETEKVKTNTHKPTVEEQVKQQNEARKDTLGESELTKIQPPKDSSARDGEGGKLTTIKEIIKGSRKDSSSLSEKKDSKDPNDTSDRSNNNDYLYE